MWWNWRAGAGAAILNRDHVTPGGTGQQKYWHKFLSIFADDAIPEYDYRDSGIDNQAGGVLFAAIGWRKILIEEQYFRFTIDAEAEGEINTIWDGSHFDLNAGIRLGFGRTKENLPVATFDITQRADYFPFSGVVTFLTEFELTFHGRLIEPFLMLRLYWGQPNNEYLLYAEDSTSTALMGVRMRF